MPELPEVETMCRGIASIVGRTVLAVQQPPCFCKPCTLEPDVRTLHTRLLGKSVEAIERRGKRVIIRFEADDRLVIEPRMTGLVLLADPPDVDHLRLRIAFEVGPKERELPELLIWDRRGLGTIRLLGPDEFRVKVEDRLGQDALLVSADELRERLRSSSRAIKVALLDQKAVAGIGNLYAAEILFVAGVDPRTRCSKLSGPQWRRIHAAIGLVLDEAILNEGSTLGDGTYRNALNEAGSYQNMHRVYDRAGDACRRCGAGKIRRIVQAQRSTFFCQTCQRKSGRHASVPD